MKFYQSFLFYIAVALLVLGSVACPTFAQAPRWLCNDSLHVRLGWEALEIVGTDSAGNWIATGGNFVAGIDLREDQRQVIEGWGRKTWLRYLRQQKAGYMTCWLLYMITAKSATVEKERAADTWRRGYLKSELHYWRYYLRRNELFGEKDR